MPILETIDLLDGLGYRLRCTYKPVNRVGDHICYISDLTKIRTHFPQWRLQYDVPKIIAEIVARHEFQCSGLGVMMNKVAR
jgi:CDP-paratose 2-epimerase